MSFEKSLAFVLASEGGYSNRPNDRGGPTNFGITQATYTTYRSDQNLPAQPVNSITQAEARDCYQRYFWNVGRCSLLPEPLDLVYFDSLVQHGPTMSPKFLQRALGIADDGVIGKETLDALRAAPLDYVIARFLAERRKYYAEIIDAHPEQIANQNGWSNRLARLEGAINLAAASS